MEPDPYFDVIATVTPIALLALMGVVAIYSVIGVPLGITLLGVALGMAGAVIWRHRHQVPRH